MAKNKNAASVENYPPLIEWLTEKMDARCIWQSWLETTEGEPYAAVEQWMVRSQFVIVVARWKQEGWQIFTEAGAHTNKIAETFAEAEERLGIVKEG